MNLKRGCKPYRPGSIRLNLMTYLHLDKLPPLPAVFGHEAWKGDWGMLGNDTAGDCVIAGACHRVMLYNIATHKPVPRFDSSTALANYSNCLVAAGQSPYDPNNPNTDTGLDPQQAIDWEKKHGIVDADGKVHHIDSYVAVQGVRNCLYAAYLFGACGLALSLPDTAETQFSEGHVWDDVTSAPDLDEGHYVVLCGRNSAGNGVVSTWGTLQAATPAWITRYLQIGVVGLSREYMMANGLSPERFNWAQLEADEQAF